MSDIASLLKIIQKALLMPLINDRYFPLNARNINTRDTNCY